MTNSLYQSLPRGDNIRVLRLEGTSYVNEPQPGWKPSQPVPVCTLKTISLKSVRKGDIAYVALSYCWQPGDRSSRNQSDDSRALLCNGLVTYVGANLFDALMHFSSLRKPPLLWVDALCIHQEDVDERNHQVSLMGHVYRLAEHVAIWLGSESHNVNELWKLLAWSTESRESTRDPFISGQKTNFMSMFDTWTTSNVKEGRDMPSRRRRRDTPTTRRSKDSAASNKSTDVNTFRRKKEAHRERLRRLLREESSGQVFTQSPEAHLKTGADREAAQHTAENADGDSEEDAEAEIDSVLDLHVSHIKPPRYDLRQSSSRKDVISLNSSKVARGYKFH